MHFALICASYRKAGPFKRGSAFVYRRILPGYSPASSSACSTQP